MYSANNSKPKTDPTNFSTAGKDETTILGTVKAKVGYLFDMFAEQSAQSGGVAVTGKTEPVPKKP